MKLIEDFVVRLCALLYLMQVTAGHLECQSCKDGPFACLNLSHSQLDAPPATATLQPRDGHHLLHVDLSSNFIPPDEALWRNVLPRSLVTLNLASNLLTRLPQALGQLVHLRELNLSDNRLRDELGTLLSLTALVQLDLGFNRLDDAVLLSKARFGENEGCIWPHLESLDLRSNTLGTRSLCHVLSAYCSPSSLRALNLSGAMSNSIMKGGIPPVLCQFTSLRSLDISFNGLKSVAPGTLGRLGSLTYLDVSHNPRLQTLPADVLALKISHLVLGTNSHMNAEARDGFQNKADDDAINVSVTGAVTLSAGEFPLLHEQLSPLSTQVLRFRLVHNHRVRMPPTSPRKAVMQTLCTAIEHDGGVQVRQAHGILMDDLLADRLLAALRDTEWVQDHERPRVNARGYIVIKRKVAISGVKVGSHAMRVATQRNAKAAKYCLLWNLATLCLAKVDPQFAASYTDLSVTKNFSGSPHIDKHDRDAQWALSLGEFGEGNNGGRLCVEEEPGKVVAINTYRRLAKMDGRFPHWVEGYSGERYSVQFFRTEGPVVPKATALVS